MNKGNGGLTGEEDTYHVDVCSVGEFISFLGESSDVITETLPTLLGAHLEVLGAHRALVGAL